MLNTLVITSDDYLHCLPGFAYLHNRHFYDHKATVLCYKKGRQSLPDNFYKYSVGRQQDYTWSGGLIKFLQEHKNVQHWMIFLEDYFITEVRLPVIGEIYDYMMRYPGVAKFDLSGDLYKRGWKAHGKP